MSDLTATEAMARQENSEMRRILEKQLILSIMRGCSGEEETADRLQFYLSEQRVLAAHVAIGIAAAAASRAAPSLITEDP